MKDLGPFNRLAGETPSEAENLTTVHLQNHLALIPNQNYHTFLESVFSGTEMKNVENIIYKKKQGGKFPVNYRYW